MAVYNYFASMPWETVCACLIFAGTIVSEVGVVWFIVRAAISKFKGP